MPRTGDTRDAAREPAREAEFRRFVLATAVSVLGTYAAAIALAVRTYQDTGHPAWVSAVFAAEFLPPVAIGVLLADRLNRFQPRRALVASDLVSAAVFAVVAGVHTPAVVVALATVAGTAAGIFRPISFAVVPAVAGEDRIDAANGTLAAVDTAMTAIGQAGAGAVVAIAGAGVVLGANAASFVMSAALLASCGSLAARVAATGARTPFGAFAGARADDPAQPPAAAGRRGLDAGARRDGDRELDRGAAPARPARRRAPPSPASRSRRRRPARRSAASSPDGWATGWAATMRWC